MRGQISTAFGAPKEIEEPEESLTESFEPPHIVECPDWFHEGQREAWNSKEIDILVVAGTQGGKTSMQSPWLMRELQRCAPLIAKLKSGKAIYAGPTMTLLAEQALPAFEDLFQDESQLGKLVKGTKPKFSFSSEGSARLLGFSDYQVTTTFAYTNDSSNLESMTAIAGVWDEVGQKENKLASYRAFNRRLTVARSITFAQIKEWIEENEYRLARFQWWLDSYYAQEGPDARFGRRLWGTTPYEWNWFKTEVYDRAEAGEKGFSFFNFCSWMNPNVSEEECRSQLDKGMNLWDWEMMYLGVYRRPAGLIYSGFSLENKVTDFEIPAHWPRYVGMDFGNENTAAVALAEDPDTKDLYVTGEYKKAASAMRSTDPFDEHGKAVKLLCGRVPSGGAGGSHQEEGWRQAIRKAGVPMDEPPVNDVEVQISCVVAQVNTNRLKVFRSCSGVISQIENYSRELDQELNPIDGTIKNKAAYHFLDALRYIVTKLRPPARLPGKPSGQPRSPVVARKRNRNFI